MMEIVLYSKLNCQFCNKAKHMIKSLGLKYVEKMMEDFVSPQAMLEDIGRPVKTCHKLKLMMN